MCINAGYPNMGVFTCACSSLFRQWLIRAGQASWFSSVSVAFPAANQMAIAENRSFYLKFVWFLTRSNDWGMGKGTNSMFGATSRVISVHLYMRSPFRDGYGSLNSSFPLVMTNSLPWKITMLLIGKPSISKWWYGDFPWRTVSHNQRVTWLTHFPLKLHMKPACSRSRPALTSYPPYRSHPRSSRGYQPHGSLPSHVRRPQLPQKGWNRKIGPKSRT